MTSAVRIYHNPRCSKSRQALQLIDSIGISPVIVEDLKYPLSYLELGPRQLMCTAEKACRANQSENPELSREDLIKATTDHPMLIERSIMMHNGKAVTGRPSEEILEMEIL